ncbi:MAG: DEAD/DEAH box helicase [Clostridia bacterium]|nr:DEAD/DEAH box helicase [Clostridia bacterium]
MLKLRDYQQDCVDAINNMQNGSALVSMATGLGKTVVFSRIRSQGRVLIISHREELVNQPIKYYECPCGIEQGVQISKGEKVVSASVQSLVRRLDKFKPTEFDVIITDEAHHAAAPSYKKIYAYFKPRLHVGFTATPNRGDKVRLDDVFEKIIFQRDLKWGIEHNWLTDINCLRVNVSYDLRKVARRMGDFAVGELDKQVNTQLANAEIAKVYKEYARGQTLIFATSVEHAENIAALIDGAVAVSQKTPNRKQIIADFTARKIPCIVNCMIFTEGTDMPLIETIIIARPTQNPSLYAQMVGRGLRKYEGKRYLTLIDCVGVTGKLDICTAPSLMGLDMTEVPDYRKGKVQGMLTNMQQIIEDACDCVESWVLNVNAVRLFAEQQGVRTYRINWVKKSNGDLVYQFSCGDRIGIKAIDELGNTFVMRYYFDDKKGDFVYWRSDWVKLQKALDIANDYFCRVYESERSFWDLGEYFTWQFKPATESQIKYIKSKLSKSEWDEFNKRETLSKGDATQIISALKVRNLKKEDLYRMHKKFAEQKAKEQEERAAYARLKIRYCFDENKHSKKLYAIKHPTDLVITNSWDMAQDIILALNQSGTECKYKSFYTVDEAREYLRA